MVDKNGNNAVLPGFCSIEHDGGSGSMSPLPPVHMVWRSCLPIIFGGTPEYHIVNKEMEAWLELMSFFYQETL